MIDIQGDTIRNPCEKMHRRLINTKYQNILKNKKFDEDFKTEI